MEAQAVHPIAMANGMVDGEYFAQLTYLDEHVHTRHNDIPR
jgi:hypothetical protein